MSTANENPGGTAVAAAAPAPPHLSPSFLPAVVQPSITFELPRRTNGSLRSPPHASPPPSPPPVLKRVLPDVIRCRKCGVELVLASQVLSKSFQGRLGPAVLVSPPVHRPHGPSRRRVLPLTPPQSPPHRAHSRRLSFRAGAGSRGGGGADVRRRPWHLGVLPGIGEQGGSSANSGAGAGAGVGGNSSSGSTGESSLSGGNVGGLDNINTSTPTEAADAADATAVSASNLISNNVSSLTLASVTGEASEAEAEDGSTDGVQDSDDASAMAFLTHLPEATRRRMLPLRRFRESLSQMRRLLQSSCVAAGSAAANVTEGPSERRTLLTGSYRVCDVACARCRSPLGWRYLDARSMDQRYKIGKYILEEAQTVRAPAWHCSEAAVWRERWVADGGNSRSHRCRSRRRNHVGGNGCDQEQQHHSLFALDSESGEHDHDYNHDNDDDYEPLDPDAPSYDCFCPFAAGEPPRRAFGNFCALSDESRLRKSDQPGGGGAGSSSKGSAPAVASAAIYSGGGHWELEKYDWQQEVGDTGTVWEPVDVDLSDDDELQELFLGKWTPDVARQRRAVRHRKNTHPRTGLSEPFPESTGGVGMI